MRVSKHRNREWGLWDNRNLSLEEAQFAVLLDIREELRTLNRLLSCPNFTRIPRTLVEIENNTSKRQKAKSTPPK